MNYDELKPGLYVSRGGAAKAVDVVKEGAELDWLVEAFGLDQRVGVEHLIANEVWTGTALRKRARTALKVPWQWYLNDNELDENNASAAPFEMNMWELVPQIDTALQAQENGAFLLKLRGRGRNNDKGPVTKVVWLDPTRMRLDMDTVTFIGGVRYFLRKRDDGKDDVFPARDILWFKRPGQREFQCGPSPLENSRRDAEILYNMKAAEDSFVEGNMLPFMLINVPASTPPAEQERVENRFWRLFNTKKNSREVKTVGVREGVSIETLSFKPSELNLTEQEMRHMEAVLAAHDVPKSIALSNAANFATALSDKIDFAETMATQMEYIASVFNNDADFEAAGYQLRINTEAMPVMQEEELRRSQGVANLVNAGETLANAYRILGYDLPDDYEEQPDEPEPMPEQQNGFAGGVPPAQAPVEPMPVRSVDVKAAEMERLRRFLANGTHLKRAFTSDVLTPAEIENATIDHEYRNYP